MIALIDGDVLLHATLWETTNEKSALDKLRYNLEDYTAGAFCEESIIAVGPYHGKNYRDDLYPDYKQTTMRVKGRDDRPEHFDKVKQYLYELDNVVEGNYIEADDLLGILSQQLKENCVITTVDKDMDQLEGIHFNPRKEKYYYISKEEADTFFLKQMILGDPMDKIPGLPNYGPVKAKKIIESTESISELAKAIIELYKAIYKEEWRNFFLANGKLLWLQRKDYDYFTLDSFNQRFINAST